MTDGGPPGGYGQQQPLYGQQTPLYGQQTPLYGQPAYGQAQGWQGAQYPQYAVAPRRQTNVLAILSLVFSCCFVVTGLLGVAGLICGIIARKQIKESGEEGDGLALAGVIIGACATGLMVLVVVAYVLFFVFAIAVSGAS